MRVHAPTTAQSWQNEQVLPVEHLCKFYPLVTCLDLFLYMLPNVFIQSIGHVSHILWLA
jgi:hypothetical protein